MDEIDEFFLKPPEINIDVISLKINGDILSSLSNDKKITFVSHGDSIVKKKNFNSYPFKSQSFSFFLGTECRGKYLSIQK